MSLLDAWMQYQFQPDWAVKFGQFKASVFQERNLSGFAQLAVDRSLLDSLIAGAIIDRVQGVSLIYGGRGSNPLRAEVAFHDGVARYEHQFNRRSHHHMVCVECGSSVEFFSPDLDRAFHRFIMRDCRQKPESARRP